MEGCWALAMEVVMGCGVVGCWVPGGWEEGGSEAGCEGARGAERKGLEVGCW